MALLALCRSADVDMPIWHLRLTSQPRFSARQGLPLKMVSTLACHSGDLIAERVPQR
jgi:hypothetical protein